MRPRPLSRWLAWLGGVAVVLMLGLWLVRAPFDPALDEQAGHCRPAVGDGDCQRITTARLAEPGGALVALPHALADRPGNQLRYELSIAVPAGGFSAGRSLGLCLPRSPLVQRVLLDGQPIDFTVHQPLRSFLRPLHLRLDHAPSPGLHQLQLEVGAPPGLKPGLGRFWVGADELMARTCGDLAASVRDRTHGITWVMAAMGLAGLLLWLRLRDRQALSFALLTLAWVLHLWVVSGAAQSIEPETWSLLFFATRVSFIAPMLAYALQLSDQAEPRAWGRGLALAWLAAMGLLALLPPAAYPSWLAGVALAALLPALGLWLLLLRALWRAASLQRALMMLAFGSVLLAHLVDMLRWLTAAGYDTRAWSYLAVPFLCLVFGARMLQDLIVHAQRDATDAQRLRHEVEVQRVRIAADYERLQQQREQLAVLQERRRIVRDMHDGLGAQLLSASARLKSPAPIAPEQVAAYFDEALQELRSVLDVLSVEPSQDPDDDPVSALLGTLRWRMAPALGARGVSLQWHCEALPAQFLASDAARMHLLRLWQEAFSNVLKHSGAQQAVFEAGPRGQGVSMRLRDDGCGFDPALTRGIGLDSMRARAEAIGARLTVRAAPGGGTELQLDWA